MSLRVRMGRLRPWVPVRGSWRAATAAALALVFAAGLAAVAESPQPARIDGLVTGEHRAPLQGARIILTPVESRATLAESTNSSGRFTFAAVPPGRYRVDVSYETRHASSNAPLMFEAGEEYTLDLPLAPAVEGE